MRILLTTLFAIIGFNSFGQIIVSRNPTWMTFDEARHSEDIAKTSVEKADRVALYAQTSQIVVNAKEHLKWVKEATQKLKEINRRVANFRYLEESIVAVSDAYNRVQRTLATLNSSSCFTIAEYRQINQSVMSLLGNTTFAISALTVVLTDNFSEMNDAERLASLSNALKQLREDLGVVDAFMNEIEILNNQRMQIKSIYYINEIFK